MSPSSSPTTDLRTPTPAAPIQRPRRTHDSLPEKLGYGAAGAALILVAWQLAASQGLFGSGLPTPVAALASLAGKVTTSQFWVDTALTVGLAAGGLAISQVIGILLGVLIGTFDAARAALLVVLEFLKPIPPIVILPLGVLVLGPTGSMALLLVVFGCAIAISIQVIAGVHDADPVARDTARAYGLSSFETLLRVTLPGALPFVGTAIRISAPASLVIVVVAGLLGGAPGLGRNLYQAQSAGDYPSVYALVIVLGVLGLISQTLSTAVERRILHWHPSFRAVES